MNKDSRLRSAGKELGSKGINKNGNLVTLRKNFSGNILLEEDENYGQFRNALYGKGSPLVILQPLTTEDVAAGIDYARKNSLTLSVRSGGHGAHGYATNNGGVVIDLSNFNKIKIVDKDKGIVRIGSGAVWGDAAAALSEFGLAISSGDTKQVGVGGLILGGGIGWMTRKHGLAIDALRGAEVVTADGKILNINSESHPDLFWAIRGGGGNFCIATEFEFEAYPVNKIVGGTIQYSTEDLTGKLKRWRDYMQTADHNLGTQIRVMPSFFGNPPAFLTLFCYAGKDGSAASNAIEPLLKLGTVVQQDIKEKNYSDILEEAIHPPDNLEIRIKSLFVDNFSDELIETIGSIYGKDDSPVLQIRNLGGAANKVASDATAFAFRSSEVVLSSAFFFPDTLPAEIANEKMESWNLIKAFGKGAYVNFLSQDEDINDIYPESTLHRLVQIKKKYDPENIFNQNYNIKPE